MERLAIRDHSLPVDHFDGMRKQYKMEAAPLEQRSKICEVVAASGKAVVERGTGTAMDLRNSLVDFTEERMDDARALAVQELAKHYNAMVETQRDFTMEDPSTPACIRPPIRSAWETKPSPLT